MSKLKPSKVPFNMGHGYFKNTRKLLRLAATVQSSTHFPYFHGSKDVEDISLGIQSCLLGCLGWVWRVQVPSEKVLGSLGYQMASCFPKPSDFRRRSSATNLRVVYLSRHTGTSHSAAAKSLRLVKWTLKTRETIYTNAI